MCVVLGAGSLLALVFGPCAVAAATLYLNVHVKLDAPSEASMVYVNQVARRLDASIDIDLTTVNQPHVTLYLTEFRNESYADIMRSMAKLISSMQGCLLKMNDTVDMSGSYALWDVLPNTCLSLLSNQTVLALAQYIVPNQPVPEWVYDLPEPERSRKIELVKDYGSPNVFDQFQPHVTLAFDSNGSVPGSLFLGVMTSIPLPAVAPQTPVLALGAVGAHGTVIRGKDYAAWPLPP